MEGGKELGPGSEMLPLLPPHVNSSLSHLRLARTIPREPLQNRAICRHFPKNSFGTMVCQACQVWVSVCRNPYLGFRTRTSPPAPPPTGVGGASPRPTHPTEMGGGALN